MNFNPRTHVGCDVSLRCNQNLTIMISIHAPTWGATKVDDIMVADGAISIHAPTWGATGSVSTLSSGLHFNPRTHVGCDSPADRRAESPPYFNPRTHVGCDIVLVLSVMLIKISIHAPTWGATISQ